jgi:hypothetical protein
VTAGLEAIDELSAIGGVECIVVNLDKIRRGHTEELLLTGSLHAPILPRNRPGVLRVANRSGLPRSQSRRRIAAPSRCVSPALEATTSEQSSVIFSDKPYGAHSARHTIAERINQELLR